MLTNGYNRNSCSKAVCQLTLTYKRIMPYKGLQRTLGFRDMNVKIVGYLVVFQLGRSVAADVS